MAKPLKRVCWDACAWIALIQDEKIRDDLGNIVEDRGSLCKAVIQHAKRGKIEIVTSGLSLAEVCKNRDIKDSDPQKIRDFFEQDYVLLAPVDRVVGERARDLMMQGFFGLKPQDACHLATGAIVPNVDEFHTFDRKLLDLNMKIECADRTMLKICKPNPGLGIEPPLLGAMQNGE